MNKTREQIFIFDDQGNQLEFVPKVSGCEKPAEQGKYFVIKEETGFELKRFQVTQPYQRVDVMPDRQVSFHDEKQTLPAMFGYECYFCEKNTAWQNIGGDLGSSLCQTCGVQGTNAFRNCPEKCGKPGYIFNRDGIEKCYPCWMLQKLKVAQEKQEGKKEGELEEFTNKTKIGEGNFGKVFQVQCLDGSKAAIKEVPMSVDQNGKKKILTENEFIDIQSEAMILQKLTHTNITKLYKVFTDKDPYGDQIFSIVMEHVNGIDLQKQIEARILGQINMKWHEVVAQFKQICVAVQYFHRLKILHRDIKPGNVMINLCGVPKIGDFGFAIDSTDSSGQSLMSAKGTPLYMAPELALAWFSGQELQFSYKTDIASLGIMFHEMLALSRPFSNIMDVIKKIYDPSTLPNFNSEELNTAVRSLISSMLDKEQAKRPDIDQVSAKLNLILQFPHD